MTEGSNDWFEEYGRGVGFLPTAPSFYFSLQPPILYLSLVLFLIPSAASCLSLSLCLFRSLCLSSSALPGPLAPPLENPSSNASQSLNRSLRHKSTATDHTINSVNVPLSIVI